MSRTNFGVNANPLIDSPYFQQNNLHPAYNPISELDWLLLDGDKFVALSGEDLEFLG